MMSNEYQSIFSKVEEEAISGRSRRAIVSRLIEGGYPKHIVERAANEFFSHKRPCRKVIIRAFVLSLIAGLVITAYFGFVFLQRARAQRMVEGLIKYVVENNVPPNIHDYEVMNMHSEIYRTTPYCNDYLLKGMTDAKDEYVFSHCAYIYSQCAPPRDVVTLIREVVDWLRSGKVKNVSNIDSLIGVLSKCGSMVYPFIESDIRGGALWALVTIRHLGECPPDMVSILIGFLAVDVNEKVVVESLNCLEAIKDLHGYKGDLSERLSELDTDRFPEGIRNMAIRMLKRIK